MSAINHGTATAYVHHLCRCRTCRDGQAKRHRDRERAKLYGRYEPKFVDAEPIRKHVQELQEQGWGVRTIADACGAHRTQIRQLLHGRTPSEMAEGRYPKPKHLTKISRATAERILAIKYDPWTAPDGSLMPAQGIHRRIQALAAIGYSLSWQANQLGYAVGNYISILDRNIIQVKTARKIRALYEAFEMIPRQGIVNTERYSISRIKNVAKKNSWLPPAAWDNIDTDETPTMTVEKDIVDSVKLDLLLQGFDVKLSVLERRTFITELANRNFQHMQIAEVIGINVKTVSRIVKEFGQAA